MKSVMAMLLLVVGSVVAEQVQLSDEPCCPGGKCVGVDNYEPCCPGGKCSNL